VHNKKVPKTTRANSKEVPKINKNTQQKNTENQQECIARKQQRTLEAYNKKMMKNNLSA
jgi:hypothetical protein